MEWVPLEFRKGILIGVVAIVSGLVGCQQKECYGCGGPEWYPVEVAVDGARVAVLVATFQSRRGRIIFYDFTNGSNTKSPEIYMWGAFNASLDLVGPSPTSAVILAYEYGNYIWPLGATMTALQWQDHILGRFQRSTRLVLTNLETVYIADYGSGATFPTGITLTASDPSEVGGAAVGDMFYVFDSTRGSVWALSDDGMTKGRMSFGKVEVFDLIGSADSRTIALALGPDPSRGVVDPWNLPTNGIPEGPGDISDATDGIYVTGPASPGVWYASPAFWCLDPIGPGRGYVTKDYLALTAGGEYITSRDGVVVDTRGGKLYAIRQGVTCQWNMVPAGSSVMIFGGWGYVPRDGSDPAGRMWDGGVYEESIGQYVSSVALNVMGGTTVESLSNGDYGLFATGSIDGSVIAVGGARAGSKVNMAIYNVLSGSMLIDDRISNGYITMPKEAGRPPSRIAGGAASA